MISFFVGLLDKNEEIEELKVLITQLDEDKDGYIKKDELLEKLKETDLDVLQHNFYVGHKYQTQMDVKDVSWKELIQAKEQIGKSNRQSAYISLEDFLKAAINHQKNLTDEYITEQLFQLVDANGDGFISFDELNDSFSTRSQNKNFE